MAIHVNIGEAKTRLSELIAAATRGEEVVVSKAGEPQVQLVPVTGIAGEVAAQIEKQRRAGFGSLAEAFDGFDLSLRTLKSDRTDPDERYRLKFAPPD